jgi:hypothetical protein
MTFYTWLQTQQNNETEISNLAIYVANELRWPTEINTKAELRTFLRNEERDDLVRPLAIAINLYTDYCENNPEEEETTTKENPHEKKEKELQEALATQINKLDPKNRIVEYKTTEDKQYLLVIFGLKNSKDFRVHINTPWCQDIQTKWESLEAARKEVIETTKLLETYDLIERIRDAIQDGIFLSKTSTILTHFETNDEFLKVKGYKEGTFSFDLLQGSIIEGYASALNITVSLCIVKPNEYFEWLEKNGKENTQKNRAVYASVAPKNRRIQSKNNYPEFFIQLEKEYKQKEEKDEREILNLEKAEIAENGVLLWLECGSPNPEKMKELAQKDNPKGLALAGIYGLATTQKTSPKRAKACQLLWDASKLGQPEAANALVTYYLENNNRKKANKIAELALTHKNFRPKIKLLATLWEEEVCDTQSCKIPKYIKTFLKQNPNADTGELEFLVGKGITILEEPEKENKLGLALLKTAKEKNWTKARIAIAEALIDQERYEEAEKEITEGVNVKDPDCTQHLATRYLETTSGENEKEEVTQAKITQENAESGNKKAIGSLAHCLSNGIGLEQNTRQAIIIANTFFMIGCGWEELAEEIYVENGKDPQNPTLLKETKAWVYANAIKTKKEEILNLAAAYWVQPKT